MSCLGMKENGLILLKRVNNNLTEERICEIPSLSYSGNAKTHQVEIRIYRSENSYDLYNPSGVHSELHLYICLIGVYSHPLVLLILFCY